MVLAEGNSEAVVAELSNGERCSILKSRKIFGAAGGKGKLGKQKQCSMHGLYIGAIGQANKDAI